MERIIKIGRIELIAISVAKTLSQEVNDISLNFRLIMICVNFVFKHHLLKSNKKIRIACTTINSSILKTEQMMIFYINTINAMTAMLSRFGDLDLSVLNV